MNSLVGVDPYVQQLSAALVTKSDELGVELADLIKQTDSRYQDENVVPTADLVRSCQDNIEMLFSALAGRVNPVVEGPRETGRRRAVQGMPLAATLRGYRIGGRFIWNVLVRMSTWFELSCANVPSPQLAGGVASEMLRNPSRPLLSTRSTCHVRAPCMPS